MASERLKRRRVVVTLTVDTNLDEATLLRRVESLVDPVDMPAHLDVDEVIIVRNTDIRSGKG